MNLGVRWLGGVLGVTVLGVAMNQAQDTDAKKTAPALKVVPAAKLVPAAKAMAKKAEETKKAAAPVVEPEDEYKKFQEAEKKRLAELGKKATHQFVKAVDVKSDDGKLKMQTLTVDPKDRVLALVAAPRNFGAAPVKGVTSEVHVYNPTGDRSTVWKVPFHGHSLNAAPDGTVYVAGDGQIAHYDATGKLLGSVVELPHIAELFKDKDALRQKAEEQAKKQQEQMQASTKAAIQQFEERVKTIEAKKVEDRSKSEVRSLDQAKQMLKIYQDMEKENKRSISVDSILASMTGRVRTINALAVSDLDVFVACGESAGWGYAVWRFDRDLKNPKKVLSDLGGCCGQIDIQVAGSDVVVAENTKHSFAKYDRDGKKIGSFGKRGVDTDPACFGGCCNPMNTRVSTTSGDVFTAESEGVVKRFSPAGKFLEVAGTVDISGGCKNVAIGVSAKGDKIFFCDQPGSKIHILSVKENKPASSGGGN
jgi:hypothetical protein